MIGRQYCSSCNLHLFFPDVTSHIQEPFRMICIHYKIILDLIARTVKNMTNIDSCENLTDAGTDKTLLRFQFNTRLQWARFIQSHTEPDMKSVVIFSFISSACKAYKSLWLHSVTFPLHTRHHICTCTTWHTRIQAYGRKVRVKEKEKFLLKIYMKIKLYTKKKQSLTRNHILCCDLSSLGWVVKLYTLIATFTLRH